MTKAAAAAPPRPVRSARPKPPAWIFYATPERSKGAWLGELERGRIEFWRHGLDQYRLGGPSYSRTMQPGDTVIVVAGDQIVGLALLAAAGEMKFTRSDNTRWWPLLIVELLREPLPREAVQSMIGRNLITNEGAVHPVQPDALSAIQDLLRSKSDGLWSLPINPNAAASLLHDGETLADALARTPDIRADAATRAALGLEPEAEPPPPPLIDALPRVFNDRHDAVDLLKIDREVMAFARLAIARDIDPPLSIGVFGDWGSGKSFFMQKVMETIHRLGDVSREADHPLHTHIHQDVVQIRFNAWHYIETNLWASLVGFIFAELDRWLKQNDVPADQVDALFDQLSTSRALKLEAYRQLIAAKAEEASAQRLVAEAQNAHRNAVRAPLSDADLWQAAASAFIEGLSSDDRKELKALTKAVGATDVDRSAKDVAHLVKDTAGQATRGRVVLTAIVARAGSFWGALLITVALLGPPLAMAALRSVEPWLVETLNVPLTALATSLSALVGLGGVALKGARKQLDVLDRLRGTLDAKLLEKTREEREAVAKAEATAREAAQTVVEAERTAARAADRVAALEREQESQTASGRLNRFIRDKVANAEYARHLGIVANIHKDFSQLSELLREQDGGKDEAAQVAMEAARKAYQQAAQKIIDDAAAANAPLSELQQKDLLERTADQGAKPPAIGRIVLYIDDLDRCPPETVVDVLQAIHMLLFFRLFVVFVAVDARWLKRSLGVRFPDLIEDRSRNEAAKPPAPAAADAAKAQPPAAADVAPPRAKPADAQDYLEKIFQLPFWVTPMSETQGRSFVMGLTAPLLIAQAGGGGGTNTDESGTEDQDGTVIEPDEEGEGEVTATKLVAVGLSQAERSALAAFGAVLGGSPRRTKRYVNTYLLIKIGQQQAAAPARSAEEAVWTIAAMLAVVVGAREAATAFFQAVEGLDDDPRELTGFDEDLAPAKAGPDGDRLHAILAAMIANPHSFAPADLAAYAPAVRRFAF